MSTIVGYTADAMDELLTIAKARGSHTGVQPASSISDLTEAVQDLMGAHIVAGANVTVTYNDAAGTITIASSGGGGGGIVEGIALSAHTLGTGSAAANVTGLNAAIAAAQAADKPLINDLGAISVNINAKIDMTGHGFTARFNGLRLVQTTANTACVRFGGSGQDIDGLRVYDSTNPTSAQTNASGFEFTNCVVSRFSNLVTENHARGFYMPQEAPTIGSTTSNTVFSCVFENIRINGWAISAIDFRTWLPGSASSTGNSWNNIYCHNNFFGSAAACSAPPIVFRAWEESVFSQFNVEWCLPPNEVVFLQECRNMLFQSVHFEGITLAPNSGLFRAYFDCRVTIHTITAMTTTIADTSGQRSFFKGYSGGATNPFSLDVTGVRIRNTLNTGSRPFALFELESGSTGGDIRIVRADTAQLVGSVIIDPTAVVPSQIERYNDVVLRNFAAPNIPIDKVRTSDATAVTSSTTLVTDGILTFPTTAGTYVVEGVLIYTCPAAGDLKYRFNHAASATGKFACTRITTAATTTTVGDGIFETTNLNTDTQSGGVDALEVAVAFTGTLIVTTAGTFAIQYAQATSNATSLVVKAHSRLSYRKIS